MLEKINDELFTDFNIMTSNVATLGSLPTVGKKMPRERWNEIFAKGSSLHSHNLRLFFNRIIYNGYVLSGIPRGKDYDITRSPYYFILGISFIDGGVWEQTFNEITSDDTNNQQIFDRLKQSSLSEEIRRKNEKLQIESHAMVVKGSRNNNGENEWLVKNSWENWGNNGELWIPSKCFSTYDELTEICFTRRVRGGKIKSNKFRKSKKSKKTKKRRTK